MSFSGRSAIVTGGTGGIGFETARNLLLQGAEKVAIFDIAYCAIAIEKLKDAFGKRLIIFRKTDLRDKVEVERSFREIHQKFGHIDVVVNCVGIIDETNFQDTIGVNLVGIIHATQTAVELMSVENGNRGGIIANIASVCGLDVIFGVPIYNATKHAIVGFTRSLADEFYVDKYGIKFVIICPGVTSTPLLHDLTDRLYRKDAEKPTLEFMATKGVQTSEVCGKLLVDVLKQAKNGSIWILDDGHSREVILQKHWNLK